MDCVSVGRLNNIAKDAMGVGLGGGLKKLPQKHDGLRRDRIGIANFSWTVSWNRTGEWPTKKPICTDAWLGLGRETKIKRALTDGLCGEERREGTQGYCG